MKAATLLTTTGLQDMELQNQICISGTNFSNKHTFKNESLEDWIEQIQFLDDQKTGKLIRWSRLETEGVERI